MESTFLEEEISEEQQLLAVENILKEMEHTEQVLLSWNAYWWETYQNAVLDEAFFDKQSWEIVDKEELKIDKTTAADCYRGLPLKHLLLGGKYNCDITTIAWDDITTKKQSRKIVFDNSGDITLEKRNRKRSKQNKKKTEYKAIYNTLSDDFSFEIDVISLLRKTEKTDKLKVSVKGDFVFIAYNDIKIVTDLKTGLKQVNITSKNNDQNNSSVDFTATLSEDGVLDSSDITINTHKGNGKVNGTYKFKLSSQNGILANFYSRKGVKIDLTTNPMLLEKAHTMMLPSAEDKSLISGTNVISTFATQSQQAIAENLSERTISFDTDKFNMQAVMNAQDLVIETLKEIKGEIPLQGLVERIDKVLLMLEKHKTGQVSDEAKTLKLK